MKTLLTAILVLTFHSTQAAAAIDLGQFQALHERSGKGINPAERGVFDCHVELESSENVLTIVQAGAYNSRMIFMGDSAIDQSETGGVITLKSKKTDYSNGAGLCGDFLSAKSVQDTLKVSGKSVEIATSYRCGLSTHVSKMTCEFN